MHKVFVSFKYEDVEYKKIISDLQSIELIDKSLENRINSNSPEYIMEIIRRDYLKDSTITIFLIGNRSAENNIFEDQYYIKKELQASLTRYKDCPPNAILGIVLPSMYERVYQGQIECEYCGMKHRFIGINPDTTIKEFSYNYYLPLPIGKCSWSEEDRYCVLAKWDDFIKNPSLYLEYSFMKRNSDISRKIKVRP